MSFTRKNMNKEMDYEITRDESVEIRGKNDIQQDGRMARCLVGALRLLTGDAPARTREEATPGPCLRPKQGRPPPSLSLSLAFSHLTRRPEFITPTLLTTIIIPSINGSILKSGIERHS